MKFKDYIKIGSCCLFAFAIGMLIALPVILKAELVFSVIGFLNRH